MNTRRILASTTTWEGFRETLRQLEAKAKGDCFETLVEHYLRLSPIYTSILKHVWHLRDVPPDKRTRLNLPGPDEGIDLVAETVDGGFWAIQCKYKEDEEHSLTRRELSTFTDLSFGICKGIEFGLVCTTADRFSHKLKLYGDRLSFCAGDVWRGLDAAFFKQLHRAIAGTATKPIPKSPLPHQRTAILAAKKHFVDEGNTRGKLLMPCGTGKSLAAFWIAEKLEARSVLVAVPSLALVRQTLEVWAAEAAAHGRAMRWMAVCSDESVGDFDRDDVAVLTQDLGVKVHTDPAEIAPWLAQKRHETTVVFTTYQSGPAIALAARRAKFTFDLGLLDEAHKTVGEKVGRFGHLLDDRNIRIGRRIFMTATERRYRGESNSIASMDDPSLYGETFDQLSFKKAIETKPPILSDYRIITVVVTREEIADLVRNNLLVKPDSGKWDREVEAATLAAGVALRRAMQRYPIRHAVSFHGSVARAKAFKDCQEALTRAFPSFGALQVFHVSGKTPTAVRSREIDAFAAARRALVTNARCLTEGVDVPGIDCVLFADPRRSTVDIVQAVGRALRISTGKKMGYVVVPVLLDKKGAPEDAAQGAAFKDIMTVLRALAANDERVVEYFRTLSKGKRLAKASSPFQIDLPIGMKIDAAKFAESIELRCWDRLARLSWRPFENARLYARGLGLKKAHDWYTFSGSGNRPSDIPGNPEKVYRDNGWVSYGDWLGTGSVSVRLRQYRPFKKARAFVRSLGLRTQGEWQAYIKKGQQPSDIPAAPNNAYRNQGWVGMGDWLGTGRIATHLRQYGSFKKARAYVQSLKLRSSQEWYEYFASGRLPSDIPSNAHVTYRNHGWISMGDWLGTGTIAPQLRLYREFRRARGYVRGLGLKSSSEWVSFCKAGQLPSDVPANPGVVYRKNGWIGYGDWLGTGTIASHLKEYLPFEKACAYARGLGLTSGHQWRMFCKSGRLPNDIPANPYQTYRNKGWKSMGDWLGTDAIASYLKEYLPFEEARAYARGLGLKSGKQWREFSKSERLSTSVPATPNRVYRNQGWKGMGDWLGTGVQAPGQLQYRSFEEARSFARGLGLRSEHEWRGFSKSGRRPPDIPATPSVVYRSKGWGGYGDWLGTGTIAPRLRRYRDFRKARAFVRRLGLKNQKEWLLFTKSEHLPEEIPASPEKTYKHTGWIGLGDWLGTGAISTRAKRFRPFKEARAFARSLGLTRQAVWYEFCASGRRPDDIPSNPQLAYKATGWAGYRDWLGSK